MDGHFVPPITFGPLVVEAVRNVTKLPLDIHLMIEQPERQFEAFIDAGGDIINFHIEAAAHVDRLLRTIHAKNKRAGICINPGTPLSAIEEVLDVADQIMVMLINPGWGGQKMLPSALDKVRALKAMLDARGLNPDIEVDGGVKTNNAAAVRRSRRRRARLRLVGLQQHVNAAGQPPQPPRRDRRSQPLTNAV